MANGSTLYLRIPTETKDAIEAHAHDQGYTLTTAAIELLQAGLQAEQDRRSVAAIGAELAELRQQNLDVQEALQREQSARINAEHQQRILAQASSAWSTRSQQIVGKCPRCKSPLRGHDVLVTGMCPKPGCGQGVGTGLAEGPGMEPKELLMVLGAAGLLLGLLVATSKGS